MPSLTQRENPIQAPHADWVTIDALFDDPYPIYQTLRAEAPIHWVPAVNRYLVLGYEACHIIEQDMERFSANESGSLMKRSMGHSMLRKDDPEHAVDRASYGATLRPRAIKESWTAIFEENSARYLDKLEAAGEAADFIWDYAAPYAAENLRLIMGFHNSTQEDMQRWSQTLINGVGNYSDDPIVWAAAERSSDEVDTAIDEMIPYLCERPDASLLSGLADMKISLEAIRANLKMTIGGGLNEPRDVLGTAIWALLTHPDQYEQVKTNHNLVTEVFDEAVRWVAPIGMYPRQSTVDTHVDGVTIPQGAHLGVVVGAGNRDPKQFEDPESFNINREKRPHLAFGGGIHYCAGAWVAKASVANVAMRDVLKRFPKLRLDESRETTDGGWVFRGMLTMPVVWN